WWVLRGRLVSQHRLLTELDSRAKPGSAGWCALQTWIFPVLEQQGDLARLLERCAAIVDVIGDAEPSRTLADCLAEKALALATLGRLSEASECGHRSLAMARELGYPHGE